MADELTAILAAIRDGAASSPHPAPTPWASAVRSISAAAASRPSSSLRLRRY